MLIWIKLWVAKALLETSFGQPPLQWLLQPTRRFKHEYEPLFKTNSLWDFSVISFHCYMDLSNISERLPSLVGVSWIADDGWPGMASFSLVDRSLLTHAKKPSCICVFLAPFFDLSSQQLFHHPASVGWAPATLSFFTRNKPYLHQNNTSGWWSWTFPKGQQHL